MIKHQVQGIPGHENGESNGFMWICLLRCKSFPLTRDDNQHSSVFIRQALGQGIRLDGRGPNEYREIEVSLSRSEMSATATVAIGNTRVVSVLSGEIIAPYPDRPTEGDSLLS